METAVIVALANQPHAPPIMTSAKERNAFIAAPARCA
jgi:hypothetical protein